MPGKERGSTDLQSQIFGVQEALLALFNRIVESDVMSPAMAKHTLEEMLKTLDHRCAERARGDLADALDSLPPRGRS